MDKRAPKEATGKDAKAENASPPSLESALPKRTRQARELGKVRWLRASKFQDALKYSDELKRPVFMLFQEIPG